MHKTNFLEPGQIFEKSLRYLSKLIRLHSFNICKRQSSHHHHCNILARLNTVSVSSGKLVILQDSIQYLSLLVNLLYYKIQFSICLLWYTCYITRFNSVSVSSGKLVILQDSIQYLSLLVNLLYSKTQFSICLLW